MFLPFSILGLSWADLPISIGLRAGFLKEDVKSELIWQLFRTVLIVSVVLCGLLAVGWLGYTLVLGILAVHHEHGLWGSIPSGVLCFALFARSFQLKK